MANHLKGTNMTKVVPFNNVSNNIAVSRDTAIRLKAILDRGNVLLVKNISIPDEADMYTKATIHFNEVTPSENNKAKGILHVTIDSESSEVTQKEMLRITQVFQRAVFTAKDHLNIVVTGGNIKSKVLRTKGGNNVLHLNVDAAWEPTDEELGQINELFSSVNDNSHEDFRFSRLKVTVSNEKQLVQDMFRQLLWNGVEVPVELINYYLGEEPEEDEE